MSHRTPTLPSCFQTALSSTSHRSPYAPATLDARHDRHLHFWLHAPTLPETRGFCGSLSGQRAADYNHSLLWPERSNQIP